MLVYLPEEKLKIEKLTALFAMLFKRSEQTVLLAGGSEPIYLPSDETHRFHRIIFKYDYFASALHELAHWCIAGRQRRKEVDYGYWYQADGRTEHQQRLFEEVEVKPQALEWILSQASGLQFRISTDNLNGQCGDLSHFKRKIVQQAHDYLEQGMPRRALILTQALAIHSRRECYIHPRFFQFEAL